MAVNAVHLADPPYWDAVMGIYRQGVWLLHHGNSLWALAHQADYLAGGPRGHTFCLLAPLFAVLARALPLKSVWVILHVLMIALAAGSLTIFFGILKKWVSPREAFLWTAVAASNPIWSGQTASLYLEIPLTFLLCLSFLSLSRENYRNAAGFCLAAYFAKNAALLLAVSFVALGLLVMISRWIFPDSSRAPRPVQEHPAWLLIPAPLMLLLEHVAGDTVVTDAFVWKNIPLNLGHTLHLSPYLYPTLIVQGLVILLLLGIGLQKVNVFRKEQMGSPRAIWMASVGLFVVGFWLSFFLTPRSLVRYTVMVQLPMIALLAILLRERRFASQGLALLFLVFHLGNQGGGLLPRLPIFIGRSGDRLERSREFLLDLQADRAMCHWLEDHAEAEPLLTKWPFAQMLTFADLGYVRTPLPNVVDMTATPLIELKAARQSLLAQAKDRRTLCLCAPTIFEGRGVPLSPRLSDRVLWIDLRLPAPLMVVERQWSVEEWKKLIAAL